MGGKIGFMENHLALYARRRGRLQTRDWWGAACVTSERRREFRSKRVIFTQADTIFMVVGRGIRQNTPAGNGNNNTRFVIRENNLWPVNPA
jgi:hypothetical protein